jgi:hypothetical protein
VIIDLFNFMDSENVGMVKSGSCARLSLKTSSLPARRETLRKYFDCDVSAKIDIASAIDLTHAAATH